MGLSKAIQGSNHTVQQITWKDERGNAVNLTGATITGKIHPHNDSSSVVAVDGTLSLVTAASGIFSWAYGTVDVGTVGSFVVQFIATYADTTKEKCFKEQFTVDDALDV
jgi:hypothetical protein